MPETVEGEDFYFTLTDADDQPVGGNAYVYGYEGEGGAATVYARFTFDTEDHMLHTPGTYTLNVPAGMFADAEGNLSEAYSASWTIKAAEGQSINIENVEIATVTEGELNDVRYTATVKFQKPAGAAYAYSEGLLLTFNGKTTAPFQFGGSTGMVELEEGDEVTLVYTDAMLAATDDAEYEGELRQAGHYQGTSTIILTDAEDKEVATAKFEGEIILPTTTGINEVKLNVNSVTIYNVAGQKLSNTHKGINIINGKKGVIK